MIKKHSIVRGRCLKKSSSRKVRARFAMTIIEVLIATTMTLLMMLALAQGFRTMSQSISEGRARLSLSDQLRGIATTLRSDLENRTTDSSTPQSMLSSKGYFKVYDGPLSDATATLFNHLPSSPTPTVESVLSASRWGDIDDILMFTVKAKPGQVFRGKIPLALLWINRLKNDSSWTVPGPWATAWSTDVTVSSEYAEVVWFMMPMNENNSIDPLSPNTMVFDVIPGVDHLGVDTGANDGIADPDGMPDRVALCRRVLLILNNLDITPTPAMISSGAVVPGDLMTMQPLVPDTSNPDTFRFMMQYPYQRCDLSVRPTTVETSSGPMVTLKTNSLEDLQQPENRFAHYTYPLPTGTSLPTLALSTETGSPIFQAMTNPVFALQGVTTGPELRDRGFLPSCFMRCKPVAVPGGGYVSVPLLEEVVASNVVAFDLMGFDNSVKQLGHPGLDGGWGVAGYDDDANGTVDDKSEAGWPGTDDQSLVPSDPGYAMQLWNINNYAISNGPPNIYEAQSGSGGFVDIGWGSKVLASIHRRRGQPTVSLASEPSITSIFKYFPSGLSGIQINPTATGLQPSTSLYNSGALFNSLPSYQAYQASFDTFTDAYEFDGEAMVSVVNGRVKYFQGWPGGLRRLGITTGPNPTLETGSDGIGYDASQKDTSPPISASIPSIQAMIRVQDKGAGALQQISVIQDLVDLR